MMLCMTMPSELMHLRQNRGGSSKFPDRWMRSWFIGPGGQIAGDTHATRRGLVMVISGEWGEGRPSCGAAFTAGACDAIIEDEIIERWICDRGQTPAMALLCDIVP